MRMTNRRVPFQLGHVIDASATSRAFVRATAKLLQLPRHGDKSENEAHSCCIYQEVCY